MVVVIDDKVGETLNTKPILFQTDMVRALLDGRKSQTRRQIKPKDFKQSGLFERIETALRPLVLDYCPSGKPGDLLYVRENFKYWDWSEDGEPWIKYAADDSVKFIKYFPEEWSDRLQNIWANLSEKENYNIDYAARDRKWRPNIFLPRWASRLTLRITDIRVERVQDITEEDAISEGIFVEAVEMRSLKKLYRDYLGRTGAGLRPKQSFQSLWNSINNNWNENPWVWVIEFELIHTNVDEIK